MIYEDYMIASLVTLIGRAPDWSGRTTDGELIAQWNIADGRVVSFSILDGDSWVEVHQNEKPPADETGQS